MAFRKALLLSLTHDRAEIEELLYSLGIQATAAVVQRRPRPDPQTYLGSGKLEEAREASRAMELALVVVDAELRPGQVFALESFFNEGRGSSTGPRRRDRRLEVYDRVRVILEIFKDRARSPEARLQVELAELRYQIPIAKEFVHLAKMGERPGFLAGGSYGVEDELDMMRSRMARIRRDLARIRAERAVRRKHRRRAGFALVALAGYTNAGKSSLLKALAGEDVLVENRYFSTLSTRTGRVETIRGRDVLMTDTVGFIEDLPPWIVEAFHATLEEISLSDVILLVIDASDGYDEIVRRLKTSERILARFEAAAFENGGGLGLAGDGGAGQGPGAAAARNQGPQDPQRAPSELRRLGAAHGLGVVLVVFNKCDAVVPTAFEALLARLVAEGHLRHRWARASALTGEGIDSLSETIVQLLPPFDEVVVEALHEHGGAALLAWLYENADVRHLTSDDLGFTATVHVAPARRAALDERAAAARGRVLGEARWPARSAGSTSGTADEERAGVGPARDAPPGDG